MKFMKFQKYGIGESDEISLLSLIRMYADISDAVEKLGSHLEAERITSGTGSTYFVDEEVSESMGRPEGTV